MIVIRKVVGEFARYSSIYVFGTKRCTIRFKVRKALDNKFVCVFIICKSIEIGCLSNLLPALTRNRDPKVSESLFGMQEDVVKSTLSIKQIA